MFKFVVLSAFLAVAAAKPSAVLVAPFTQYSTIVAPGSTSISQYDTSVIHPTPINYYTSPQLAVAHLIKKRSPQLPLSYYTPSTYIAPTTYIAPNSYLGAAPLVSSAPLVPALGPITSAVHLIKKRSAPVLSANYYTHQVYTPQVYTPRVYTAASAPVLTTSYASTAPLITVPGPLGYTQLIKKRSAPF